jgi:hypothetical protein
MTFGPCPPSGRPALLAAQLAQGVISLNEQLNDLDALIEDRLGHHPSAEVIRSMPASASCSVPSSSPPPEK